MSSKKRRMVDFRIDEISAVDNPAQAHAKIVLVKRHTPEDAEAELVKKQNALGELIAKMYVDPQAGALTFAEALDLEMQQEEYYAILDEVCPLIYAMETSLKSIAGDQSLEVSQKLSQMREAVEGFMSTIRAKWEGVTDIMYVVAQKLIEEPIMAKTHKQLLDEVAELTAQLEAAKKASSGTVSTEELEALKAQVEKLTTDLAKVSAEKDEAVAKAALSDTERAFHATLDAENAAEFVKMNAKARASFMKTAAETDDTLTIAGRTVRKSVVGEDVFEIMKAQEERQKEIEKQAAKDRDERITTQLAKRVDDELDNLPGTVDEKVALLKAVSSLGAAETATLNKILKASNDAMSGAFKALGHNDGKVAKFNRAEVRKDGEHPFMKKVNEIKATEKLKGTEAMAEARKRYPNEYADFAGKEDDEDAA